MTNFIVLHVIDHLALGGAQRGMQSYMKIRPSDRLFVLRLKTPNKVIHLPERSIIYAGSKSVMGYFLLLPRLFKLVNKERFDIFHFHLQASWLLGYLLSLLVRKKKLCFVFHERGPILLPSIGYKFLTYLISKNHAIISVSNHILRTISPYLSKEARTMVIYNQIDLGLFKPEPRMKESYRSEFGFYPQDFIVGFAGRIINIKGWKVLLDAVKLLVMEPDIKVVISGVGPKESELRERIIESGWQDKVKFMGFITEMNKFYNSINVCVVPSLIEPVGNVQVEAQACGTPVIASDIPGINETIDNTNALLIPVANPSALGEAILKLKRDRSLGKKLASAGLQNVKRYSFDQIGAQIEEMYAQMCSKLLGTQ